MGKWKMAIAAGFFFFIGTIIACEMVPRLAKQNAESDKPKIIYVDEK